MIPLSHFNYITYTADKMSCNIRKFIYNINFHLTIKPGSKRCICLKKYEKQWDHVLYRQAVFSMYRRVCLDLEGKVTT